MFCRDRSLNIRETSAQSMRSLEYRPERANCKRVVGDLPRTAGYQIDPVRME